jgi:mannosyltransferase OCH1-like enzyme
MKMPKMMHMVWIGDESKMPRTMIKSWQTLNPDWQLKVWGNAELKSSKWINRKHLNAMLNSGRYSGAADIMRYEILFKHGGFALDADSFCVRPLEEWLFDSQVCASMENEHMRPGLIANGYLAAEPQAALIAEVILAIETKKTVLDELPWAATGPLLLTKTYQRLRYDNITLWPSHYFIPRHFTGAQYLGSGHIFGHQLWGTTFDINDSLTEIFARYQR